MNNTTGQTPGIANTASGAADMPEARLFAKKPVTIAALQWTGKNLREVITFTDGPPDTRTTHAGMAWEAYADLVARDGLKIYTLEGKMLASPGDWIIRGVKGEYYPCKPDIFEATYSPAALAAVQATAAQPAPATQQAGIPGNFITHRAAWRGALETAKFVSTGVDRSYWDHELAAFDRSFDRLWTLMRDAPQPVAREPLNEARRMFEAGWKAAALFCDREDVAADGVIGFGACPQFEAAFSAAHGIKGGQHGTE